MGSSFRWNAFERHTLFVLACTLTSCGAAPQVQPTPDYRADALRTKAVLFVPLAVSNDLGDERTGIVLSDSARLGASSAACRHLAETWSDGRLVCFDEKRIAGSPEFSELVLLFALDKPIPADLWQRVRRASGAEYALLFRPESVSSSQEVSQETRGMMMPVGGLATSVFVSAMLFSATARTRTANTTELSYTVSASLVEMPTGKLLKVGVHSASDSRTVNRNLGFAEPPPAAPILEEVMTDLGEEVLDD